MTFFDFEPIEEKLKREFEKEQVAPGVYVMNAPEQLLDVLSQRAQSMTQLVNEINTKLDAVANWIDAIPDDLEGDLFCICEDPEEFFSDVGQLITLLSVYLFISPLDEEQKQSIISKIGEALLLAYSYGFWAGTEQEKDDVSDS